MEIVGCELTWALRARSPFEGLRPEGNLMVRLRVGVKVEGMTEQGRSFALLSESMRAVNAMFAISTIVMLGLKLYMM
jgi:hypothetical protein